MVNIDRELGFKNLLIILIVSFIVSVYGLSFSYHDFITKKSSQGEFQDISGDGWITEKSKIEFRNLSPKFNKLELTFNPWRPDGTRAGIVVKVCDNEVGRFAVEDNFPKTVSLNGTCEPRVVSFSSILLDISLSLSLSFFILKSRFSRCSDVLPLIPLIKPL